MIAGGCIHCGGTAGSATVPDPERAGAYLQMHALCWARHRAGRPTPSLGNQCPCCKGSGCHPRSPCGPINPNQDAVERWAPACVTCKGSGAIDIADASGARTRELEAAKKRHWFERCVTPRADAELATTGATPDR